MINKNRVIAACTPCTVVSRSSVMSLIITFMFEPAKLADELGKRERSQEATPRNDRACRCGIRAQRAARVAAAPAARMSRATEIRREVAERTREVGHVRPPPHAVLPGGWSLRSCRAPRRRRTSSRHPRQRCRAGTARKPRSRHGPDWRPHSRNARRDSNASAANCPRSVRALRASAFAFSASNSSCVIAPESSSSLAFAISAADPPPAVSRT